MVLFLHSFLSDITLFLADLFSIHVFLCYFSLLSNLLFTFQFALFIPSTIKFLNSLFTLIVCLFNCPFISVLRPFAIPIPPSLYLPFSWFFTQWQLTFQAVFFSLEASFCHLLCFLSFFLISHSYFISPLKGPAQILLLFYLASVLMDLFS